MERFFPEATLELQEILQWDAADRITIEDLQLLQDMTHSWAVDTFGDCHYHAQVRKLQEEVMELVLCRADRVPEELADCLLLILDIAKRNHIGVKHLIWTAKNKHYQNKAKKWEPSYTSGGYTIYRGRHEADR